MKVNDLQIDEEWYLTSYPVAREEISSGAASSVEEHFVKLGASRGYVPSLDAVRYEYAPEDKLKGLWTDDEGAEEQIEGRLEGQSPDYRAPLMDFIRHGYCILPKVLSEDVVAEARQSLESIYRGEDKNAVFSGAGLNGPWQERVLTRRAKALDTHMHSEAIRNAILHDKVVGFLNLLFGEPSLASQSLGFWRGSQQRLHQDSAFVTYSAPLKFVGAWTALEDVSANSGELEYALGSHKLPFYFFADLISVHEARRIGAVQADEISAHKAKYEEWLQSEVKAKELKMDRFLARAGDVLIWHAQLAHGGTKLVRGKTRKSVVTHFCPHSVVPTFFERKKRWIGQSSSSSHYTSRVFKDLVA